MADSPRNRRRTGTPSGARPKVAGLRKRTSTQGAPDSEKHTAAEASGSHEEPTEVQNSQAGTEESTSAVGDGPSTKDDQGVEDVQDAEGPRDTATDDRAESVETAEAQESGAVLETGSASSADGAESREADESAETSVTRRAETSSADDAQAPADTGADAEARSGAPSVARQWLLPALAVAAVVCTVLAIWFQYEAHSLRNEGPASNEALSDGAATSEVNGQISDAVAKLFSYDFSDTAKTENAAKNLLVGDATKEYDQLFSTVKEQAPKQNLVVTTTVKSSGVTSLQGDRAQVLLFVDQEAVRTDSGKNNVGPAQISVGAEKHGDQWKINKIVQR